MGETTRKENNVSLLIHPLVKIDPDLESFHALDSWDRTSYPGKTKEDPLLVAIYWKQIREHEDRECSCDPGCALYCIVNAWLNFKETTRNLLKNTTDSKLKEGRALLETWKRQRKEI